MKRQGFRHSPRSRCPRDAVVTVEPGIYFPGWGGVRLEEDIHLGNDGATLLSRGASELIELT